jgi:glucose-6-phosphate isomerase
MALSINNPTVFRGKIRKHFEAMKNASMQEMFIEDKTRADKFNLQWNDF